MGGGGGAAAALAPYVGERAAAIVAAPAPAGDDDDSDFELEVARFTDILASLPPAEVLQIAARKSAQVARLEARATSEHKLMQKRKFNKRRDRRTAKPVVKRRCNMKCMVIERKSEKEYSWLTTPGLLSIAVRRMLSSSSSRGFGLAAGAALSRQEPRGPWGRMSSLAHLAHPP